MGKRSIYVVFCLEKGIFVICFGKKRYREERNTGRRSILGTSMRSTDGSKTGEQASPDVGICEDLVFTQYSSVPSNTLPKYSTMVESFSSSQIYTSMEVIYGDISGLSSPKPI
jgi:hypothetical protein